MKVCIAEKPSVAKEIAQVLRAHNRRDGYFEGNGYQVTWTFGHLCTLNEPHDYEYEWKKWNINTLPMLPQKFATKIIKRSGVGKQFKIIKNLVNKSELVINCGDAGIEVELIQRWVLEMAGFKKTVKRLWISSLTEEAIKEGFKTLKDSSEFDHLYAAGRSRAIGDWLLGMNATRIYTLKYAKNRGVLSVGRVQTPTLALIVKRFKEIENFKSEKYWEIKSKYRNVIFSLEKKRFKKEDEAKKIIDKIKHKSFKITSFTKKKVNEPPPKLLDLTSLQVEANKKYGMSAGETLKIAQKVYEKKAMTYPRVDTNYLPSDVFPKISVILKKMSPYEKYIAPILKDGVKKQKRIFNDKKVTDHHAIIPTGLDPKLLSHDEKKIYDLVARRFIAAFSNDCIVFNTKVIGEVQNFKFKATGRQVVDKGWRNIFKDQKSLINKDSPQTMPIFKKGESGTHEPMSSERKTHPPKLYTDATLLRAMESAGKHVEDEELRELMKENGIGRPSTRANIIETLFRRKYIIKQRKSLLPTQTGVQLINTIKNELLKSAELTGQWERKLHLIESGQYESNLFIKEMQDMVSSLVTEVKKENRASIHIENSTTSSMVGEKLSLPSNLAEKQVCPKCHKGIIIKGKTAYGCSHFKSGCIFKIPFVINNKKLTQKQIIGIIKKGKSSNLKNFIINGQKVSGTIKLDNQFVPKLKNIKKQLTSSEELICPKCNQGSMIKGKQAYGCNRYKENCHFIITFDTLRNKFQTTILTKDSLKQI